MIVSNTRAPDDIVGDLHAQIEATRVAERELFRLVDKYGRDDGRGRVRGGAGLRRAAHPPARRRPARRHVGDEDYVDFDPALGEGLIPVRVKMTIEGDQIHYDLSGLAPGDRDASSTAATARRSRASSRARRCSSRTSRSTPASTARSPSISAPRARRQRRLAERRDRLLLRRLREDRERGLRAVVAGDARARDGVLPQHRVPAVGGRDARPDDRPFFMWYDWMVSGWGGRNGRDGPNCTSTIFGVGEAVQPFEGQERLTPGAHHPARDPPRLRRARAVPRRLRRRRRAARSRRSKATVMSYCCDRARSITWGIAGRPAVDPAGRLAQPRDDDERFLGAIFSGVPVGEGDPSSARRPAAAARRPARARPRRVLEDVADGYVTVRRARSTTASWSRSRRRARRVRDRRARRPRASARASARGAAGWLDEDPEDVAAPLPRRRARRARPRPPLRRHPRLGQRRAAAADDRAVPRHATSPRLGALAGGPRATSG